MKASGQFQMNCQITAETPPAFLVHSADDEVPRMTALDIRIGKTIYR
jgi:hypothetical protein